MSGTLPSSGWGGAVEPRGARDNLELQRQFVSEGGKQQQRTEVP